MGSVDTSIEFFDSWTVNSCIPVEAGVRFGERDRLASSFHDRVGEEGRPHSEWQVFRDLSKKRLCDGGESAAVCLPHVEA